MYGFHSRVAGLGAIVYPKRFDMDYFVDKVEFENRDTEPPAYWFWLAKDLTYWLYRYLMETRIPSLYDPQQNKWDTTPAVNMVVDVNTALRKIDQYMKNATVGGYTATSGRAKTWLEEMEEHLVVIKRITDAVWEAVRNADSMAITEARRQAEVLGGSREGLDLYLFNITRGAEQMKTTAVEATKEVVREVTREVERVDWTGLGKIAMPLAVAGILGYMLIRKI